MRNKLHLSTTIVVLVIIAFIIFIFRATSLIAMPLSFVSAQFAFVEQRIVDATQLPFKFFSDNEKIKLQKEVKALLKKIVDQQALERENNALKDQFSSAVFSGFNLLPASVISMPGFIPGVTVPEYIIVDKGKKAGVDIGYVVIVEDMVVGKIIATTPYVSKIQLITNTSSSFTAKTFVTQALGVIKGEGERLVFENVLLSEKLQSGDILVTKGDVNVLGKGYPPDLIIGKIEEVEKKSSALFQAARVKSLVNFAKLSTVFIIVGFK